VQAGGPSLESSTPMMFLAPAETPPEIVNRLSAAVARAVGTTDLAGKLDALGIEPVGNTPREATRFLEDEVVKWGAVIRKAGVKAE